MSVTNIGNKQQSRKDEAKRKDALASAEYFFNKGRDAWFKGNHPSAIRFWEESDKAGFETAGFIEAHYLLGKIYYKGIDVPKRRTVGLEYLVEAADRGHSGAKSVLEDIGLDCKALHFYQSGEVYLTLATAYDLGLGVDKNPAKAQEYRKKFHARFGTFKDPAEPQPERDVGAEFTGTREEPPHP